MTIFHVLKYPWSQVAHPKTDHVPEFIRNEFRNQTIPIIVKIAHDPNYMVGDVFAFYEKLYIQLLTEYDGPL